MRLNLDGNRQRELAAWMWNNGGAQMTAAIAFGVVVLAVIVSVQPGSIMKDLIAGFGAAGQVFFAGMVWKLSREQFRFTKEVAAKQNKIDLLPGRAAAVEAMREIHLKAATNSSRSSIMHELSLLNIKIHSLFSETVWNALTDYLRSVLAFQSFGDVFDIATRNFRSPGEVQSIVAHRNEALGEMERLWRILQDAFESEMKVI